ncbi:MAG: S8 family serine peptidase [Solirubrobacteraceae bacterium]
MPQTPSSPFSFPRSAARSASVIALALTALVPAASAGAAPFLPGRIVVRFARGEARAALAGVGGARRSASASHTRVIELPRGRSLKATLRSLRSRPGVIYAVPDVIAHTANFAPPPPAASPTPQPTPPPTRAPLIPNDPGLARIPGGWQNTQWNFVGPFGVNAPAAWSNLAAVGRPGGQGVVVAVLDTGVAYTRRGKFRKSPDFSAHQFVRGFDFVDSTRFPNDHEGHGTHVAGTIAEKTDNGIGLTGLAYGVRIMPLRVLDSVGDGDASEIAAGVVYAVRHHAQVINMSLEFTSDVTARSIPELIDAIRYAHRHGVLVVAAAGNEGASQISYPARAPFVLSVGATTEHGCLADFANYGPGLDIFAPGGGADAAIADDPNCRPGAAPPGRDIYQETFIRSPRHFGFPSGYEGTSMAAPHVAAAAALVIASGVLGRRPTPDAIAARLKRTARPIGPPGDVAQYGAGLMDAAAATRSG